MSVTSIELRFEMKNRYVTKMKPDIRGLTSYYIWFKNWSIMKVWRLLIGIVELNKFADHMSRNWTCTISCESEFVH